MIARAPIEAVTLRGLLDRKRTWLMVALAAIPVLLTALVSVFGEAVLQAEDFDSLVVATVLPLIALVFGVAALGTELDDGTIVYLLTKPVRRLRIILAKALVAAGLTAALVVPSAVLTGVAATLGGEDLVGVGMGYALAAAAGGVAYVLLFLAVSTFTSRALAVGLAYVLLWEGILANLLEGTRAFSIRQATLGLARELAGEPQPVEAIGAEQGLFILGAVVVLSITLATWRLARFQLRSGE